jgi:hypothetical protein
MADEVARSVRGVTQIRADHDNSIWLTASLNCRAKQAQWSLFVWMIKLVQAPKDSLHLAEHRRRITVTRGSRKHQLGLTKRRYDSHSPYHAGTSPRLQ